VVDDCPLKNVYRLHTPHSLVESESVYGCSFIDDVVVGVCI